MNSARDPSANFPERAAGKNAIDASDLNEDDDDQPKPKRRGMTPEQLASQAKLLDQFMVVCVLVLAFFVASFAASNTDVWMHLATGRLIAQGAYSFGSDPFAFTTSGLRWVNTTWLSDLIAYGAVQAGGGPDAALGGGILVFLKALLIALAVAVIIGIHRPGQGLLAPVFFATLAVLAMMPRLLLQPTCISLLFLGLTLYLLQPSADPARHKKLLCLPVLFLFWVNLDSWFLLGPLALGLYLVGEFLQIVLGPKPPIEQCAPARLRRLGMVFVAGLSACVVNPFGIYVFTLPPDLHSLMFAPALRADPGFQAFFMSPLETVYRESSVYGQNTGGIAYFALVALSLLSFVLNAGNWRWSRGLVWLAFCLLSLYSVRAIPFFAVVAAPMAALNVQDFAARRFGAGPAAGALNPVVALGGRVVCILLLLAMLFVAWPGWLMTLSEDLRWNRHVAWKLNVDASLRQTCERLAELRREGLFSADSYGFNYVPDIANYCAWYCPEERCFFDHRYQLFPNEIADEFLRVRRSFSARQAAPPSAAPSSRGPQTEMSFENVDWQEVFRSTKRPIDHVYISGIEGESKDTALLRFWLDPAQWTMLFLDGRSAIFGWNDPRRPPRQPAFATQQFSLNRLAFGANLPTNARAPAKPPPSPQQSVGWERYVQQAAELPVEAEESTMYLKYGEAVKAFHELRRIRANSVAMFGGALSAALGRGILLEPALMNYLRYPALVRSGFDPASGAAPLLAVRAARRAVAASPDNPDCYYSLARAYQFLWNLEKEHGIAASQLFDTIREVQIVSALHFALALKPNHAESHRLLAQFFLQMNNGDPRSLSHLDLAVEHGKEWLKIVQEVGPQRGESLEGFAKRIAAEEESMKRLEQSLTQRRTEYQLKSERQPQIFKAQLAIQYGLAKESMDALLGDNAPQLDQSQKREFFTMLLRSGRIAEMQSEEIVIDSWNKVLIAAATGDYRKAQDYLADLRQRDQRSVAEEALQILRAQTTAAIVNLRLLNGMNGIIGITRHVIDLAVLQGMMALEEGDTEAARKYFEQALSARYSAQHRVAIVSMLAAATPLQLLGMYGAGAGPLLQFDFMPMADRYLSMIEDAEKEAARSAKRQ